MNLILIITGATLIALTLGSAIRSVVLPRGVQSSLTRLVFRAVRVSFGLVLLRRTPYARVDSLMARLAPMTLVLVAFVWEGLVLIGFAMIFMGIGSGGWREAFEVSGSSITTLGFAQADSTLGHGLMFLEAALGLFILALLITFLPSLYGSFARREVMVAMLEVRAGTPPSLYEMIGRYHRIHGLDRLSEIWPQWEVWFAEIEESHTTFPSLAFFRSPQPRHSWITSAGAILDAASFRASSIDLPREPAAELCIRAGYIALRRIAEIFSIGFHSSPSPTDPISIDREEFDDVWDKLAEIGVPLKPDREQAWRDFSGWRVNYDSVLLALSGLVLAPEAPWSSDRASRFWKFSRTGGTPQRL